MFLLTLDTSTRTTSVAVSERKGSTVSVVSSQAEDAAKQQRVGRHSENIMSLIDNALSEAGIRPRDLGAIGVGTGPGSFTGLRIGMATAKGLAFGLGIPLSGVSSLAVLATDVCTRAGKSIDLDRSIIVPVLDARKQELFVGAYMKAGPIAKSIAGEKLVTPDKFNEYLEGINTCGKTPVFFGDGISLFPDLFATRNIIPDTQNTPSAQSVAQLTCFGERFDALQNGTPTYVRPSEAEIRFPLGNPGGTFAQTKK